MDMQDKGLRELLRLLLNALTAQINSFVGEDEVKFSLPADRKSHHHSSLCS